MFVNTRIMGMKVPFHVNFEEVNLRFYVKRVVDGKLKRGVVFIKEIVPKSAITIVANSLYNEHYQTLPMSHNWDTNEEYRSVEYSWRTSQKENSFKVHASLDAEKIEPESEVEFITEHYWGYTRVKDTKTFEYEVTHPRWLHYPVRQYKISADFGKTYGPEFSWLDALQPVSVFLAEGSEITVENKKEIKMG